LKQSPPTRRGGQCLLQFPTPVITRRSFFRSIVRIALACLFLAGTDGSSQKRLASASASISLVATLESLSVQATPQEGISFSMDGNRTRRIPFTVTTCLAVSANLTTVRVSHDGIPLFSQNAGDTNRVTHRSDDIQVIAETLNATDHEKSEPVVIIVEAL
jgi:hypothetical protein